MEERFWPGALSNFLNRHLAEATNYINSSAVCVDQDPFCSEREKPFSKYFSPNVEFVAAYDQIMGR